MRMKKVPGQVLAGIICLAVIVLFSSYVGAASKNDSVGYVDMQRLQNELPDFIKLQEIAKDKTQELNYFRGYLLSQQQNAINDLQKKAAAEKEGKSAAEKDAIDKKLQDDTNQKNNDVNTQIQKKIDELQQYINEQKNATIDRMKAIIAKVADDKKLSLVVEKSICFYGGTDITQAVIDQAKKQADAAEKGGTTPAKK
jgi:Outer membrane protein